MRRARCEISQLANDGDLLLALRQGAGVRGHVDANVIRITIDVAQGAWIPRGSCAPASVCAGVGSVTQAAT